MKDSHAGAFAIIIGICWFVLDFGIYSEADAHTIGLLAIGFVISRTLSGLSLVSFRMAKNTGLAATFSDMALKSRVRIVMICYLIVCAGLLLYLEVTPYDTLLHLDNAFSVPHSASLVTPDF